MGGVPGTRPDELHEWLHMALANAKMRNQNLTAMKLDLLKCFDKVLAKQGIAVLRALGLPENICKVLEFFYENYIRWVEYKGACAEQEIKALMSILQGCPASCLILNALTERLSGLYGTPSLVIIVMGLDRGEGWARSVCEVWGRDGILEAVTS